MSPFHPQEIDFGSKEMQVVFEDVSPAVFVGTYPGHGTGMSDGRVWCSGSKIDK